MCKDSIFNFLGNSYPMLSCIVFGETYQFQFTFSFLEKPSKLSFFNRRDRFRSLQDERLKYFYAEFTVLEVMARLKYVLHLSWIIGRHLELP